MGKNIVQQKRGCSPRYRAPSFRYAGESLIGAQRNECITGRIIDLVDCPGHSAPLAKIKYDDGEETLMVAPEGVRVGEIVQIGPGSDLKTGNVIQLKDVPEGTSIYNIEAVPGDGGRFVRASGTFAKVVSKTETTVIVKLPSRKDRVFNADCRACIGVIAGSGRPEKPFLKAGTHWKLKRATNKLYPITSPTAMMSAAHPFGNTRSKRKSKARPASRNAPPGRKVGPIASRRTGRKKR